MGRRERISVFRKIFLRILALFAVSGLAFIPLLNEWNIWGAVYGAVVLTAGVLLFASTFAKRKWITLLLTIVDILAAAALLVVFAVKKSPGYLFEFDSGTLAAGLWAAAFWYSLSLLICVCTSGKSRREKKEMPPDDSGYIFCPRCGERLNAGAAFCKKCGCRMENGGAAPVNDPGPENKKKRPGGGKGRKFGAVFAVILMLCSGFGTAVSTGLVPIGFLSGLGDGEPDNTEFNQLTGKFTSIEITDESSAIAAVQDAAGMLGLSNAAEELTVSNTTTSNAGTFYRLQQNYEGIPVYGRQFVVVADEDGIAQALTSNALDIGSGLSLEPEITQEQAEAAVTDHIETNFGSVDTGELTVDELSDDKLVIYSPDGGGDPILAYELGVYGEGLAADVLVSADDGTIILFNDQIHSFQQEFTSRGQKKDQTFTAEKGDSSNSMLYESKTGTKITVNVPADGHKYDWYYDENYDTVTWKDGSQPDQSAVDAMANTQKVYQYYYDAMGRDSYTGEGDDINVYVHVNGLLMWDASTMERANNAFSWFSPNGMVLAVEVKYDSDGNETTDFGSDLDAIAHEYTHGVVRYTSGLSNTADNNMPSAINEALADIMGYCVEAEDGNGEMDWISAVRCSYKGTKLSEGHAYHMKDYSSDLDEHYASTIISYAAYLMYTGVGGDEERFDTQETAEIWYNANLLFPSDCTFGTVRECVKTAADLLYMSDGKKECIDAAFDKVGIEGRAEEEKVCSTDAELTVLDKENTAYDDYTVNIDGKQKSGLFGWFRKDYSDEIRVTDADPVRLGLPEGTYTVTVTDHADEERQVSINIKTEEDSENTHLDILTNFGMDYTVSENASLSVYDINSVLYGTYTVRIQGSTQGEEGSSPYDETREITSPEAVRLGLTAGKYTLTLADSQDLSKEKTVTVRVKTDALTDQIKVKTDFGKKAGEFNPNDVPAGASEYNGHYYYIYRFEGDINSLDAARAFCESKGGYLATVTYEKENEFIYSLLTKQDYDSAFFGMNRSWDDWAWTNGEAFGYSEWASGEPEEYGGSYGIYYRGGTDQWHTADIGYGTDLSRTGFICEWGEYEMANAEVIGQGTKRTTSDERDVVLVLDTSGSMAGEPIEETREASRKFVDTVLKADASVGVVSYSEDAGVVNDFSMDQQILNTAINTYDSGGGTNMEAGLSKAREMLGYSKAKKQIIVLMSDGLPNRGKTDQDLIDYADSLKEEGIYIYTLGFFSSVSENEKASVQMLMEEIASEGCHYEVDSVENLRFFFNDIADQISGQQYIYIRIACPVDVKVTYNGETLDSGADGLNTRTEFGTLTFEENRGESREEDPGGNEPVTDTGPEEGTFSFLGRGSDENGETKEAADPSVDDRVKILRLKDGVEYDVEIEGTGEGSMDYTIGFMDESGEYTDFRTFEDIGITRKTKIDTVAQSGRDTVLKVDEDGDGKYDLTYRAGENEKGRIVDYTYILYIAAGAAGVLVILLLALIIRYRVRKSTGERKNKYRQ